MRLAVQKRSIWNVELTNCLCQELVQLLNTSGMIMSKEKFRVEVKELVEFLFVKGNAINYPETCCSK